MTPTPTPSPTPTPEPTPQPTPTPPPGETPEQKTAREAAEKTAKETKDDKTKAGNDTKAKPYVADELKALIPEGIEYDEQTGKDFVDLVNKYGLPRDAVTDLVGLQNRAVQAHSDANAKLWGDTQDQWRDQVSKDAEIGGDKTTPALANISKLLDKYGKDIPTLRQAFDLTGAGNHPDMVKFLSRVAKDLAEGGPVSGNPSGAPKDQASTLYPNQGKT